MYTPKILSPQNGLKPFERNLETVRRKGTAKGQKERAQMWNAQKERKERAKGTAKGAEDFLIKKAAAKAAKDKSAPRPIVATA